MLTTLVQVAPLISSIALIVGAIGAWATLIFVQRRTLEMQWVEAFRHIYSEFWKDESIANARRRIDNDHEFAPLQKTISRLLSDGNVDMDSKDYELLEDLDKFCALLLRAAFFNKRRMTSVQRELWTAMFESYWVNRLYERPELKIYVERYWPSLYKLTYRRDIRSFFKERDLNSDVT